MQVSLQASAMTCMLICRKIKFPKLKMFFRLESEMNSCNSVYKYNTFETLITFVAEK